MKKFIFAGILGVLFCAQSFGAPATFVNKNVQDPGDGSLIINNVDKDGPATKFNQKVDGFTGVTIIKGSKVTKKNPVNISLEDFANKDVMLSLSCDIKVENPNSTETDISWMIDELSSNLPTVVREKVPNGEWKTLSGEIVIPLNEKRNLYISAYGLDIKNTTIYIKNLNVKFTGDDLTSNPPPKQTMVEAPALKKAYKPYFDYVGFACDYRSELNNGDILEGLSHQVDCITLGNQLKPDFLFNWQRPGDFVDFTAEDGKTYTMPGNLPDFRNLQNILNIAKAYDLKIRGHVLVWHSQTPVWFFKENFENSKDAPYVDAATMTARQEWYIKSVLEYVKEFEETRNKGKHLIIAWDVVNEAVADGASSTKWLREDSDWFRIYKDETFIVNAFRYANKYAPADIELVYNDYNCYSKGKNAAIANLVDIIRSAPDARIDVIGMQSHVGINSPAVTGPNSFEAAVQNFLAKDVNVQITELDIANGNQKYSSIKLKSKYKEYYKMFLANRKKDGKKGIEGVTIWGLRDEGTWLNSQDQYKNNTQYPLLFEGNDFTCKPAFYGVLEAAESYTE